MSGAVRASALTGLGLTVSTPVGCRKSSGSRNALLAGLDAYRAPSKANRFDVPVTRLLLASLFLI